MSIFRIAQLRTVAAWLGKFLFRLGAAASLPLVAAAADAVGSGRPNIVYILCDDLGYGDVRCFNPQGRIPTPHLDRVAAEGMRFTDAHSSSSVCTPTRYGVLTGRYNWRTRLQRGVLGGLSPRLIEEGRLTVAELLRQAGYKTLCVGKWHLGMNWVRLPGREVAELDVERPDQVRNVDYARRIAGGPTTAGFDHFFGISASLDMVPYAFIEDDRLVQAPSEDTAFPMMGGRPARKSRFGPAAPGFTAEAALPAIVARAVASIRALAEEKCPFFLYLPLPAPHTPIAPTAEWLGRSGLNPYADFVMQVDAAVGEIMRALAEAHCDENSLVIVTSDNGCSPQARYEELVPQGHNPSAQFRGWKTDIFEGGHRVPFIARWPDRIRRGSVTHQMICLTDFMATCAEMVGAPLPENAAEDSISLLPVMLGRKDGVRRESMVHHSGDGLFALREGRWKLVFGAHSGGSSAPRAGSPEAKALPPLQLFDLENDPAEQHNTIGQHPEIAVRLTTRMAEIVADGRSTPGLPQANAGPISWRGEAGN